MATLVYDLKTSESISPDMSYDFLLIYDVKTSESNLPDVSYDFILIYDVKASESSSHLTYVLWFSSEIN